MNARFWHVFPTGPDGCTFVKLTLEPGQVLEWYTRERTEEGWSSTWYRFEHDEDRGRVILETVHDGRDCDGRLTTGTESYAPIGALAAEHGWGRMVPVPVWTAADCWQRDEYAERMGY